MQCKQTVSRWKWEAENALGQLPRQPQLRQKSNKNIDSNKRIKQRQNTAWHSHLHKDHKLYSDYKESCQPGTPAFSQEETVHRVIAWKKLYMSMDILGIVGCVAVTLE